MSQPTPQHDYYAILQIPPTADTAAVKAAYRKLALTKHPDRNTRSNATAEFQLISKAYETLVDDEKRRAYDAAYSYARTKPKPSSEDATPPSEEAKNRIAELSTWLQQLERNQRNLRTSLNNIRTDSVRLTAEVSDIQAERAEIEKEQAAENRWFVGIGASVLGRRGSLERRREERDSALVELVERQGVKEKAIRDGWAQAASLRTKIESSQSAEDKVKAQIEKLKTEGLERLFFRTIPRGYSGGPP